MNFSERIKELRREKGTTQLRLAQHLCVDQSTITKWETNGFVPSPDILKKLALFFNVSIDYLLGHSDDKNYIMFNDKVMPSIYFNIANVAHEKKLSEKQVEAILSLLRSFESEE